MTYEDPSREADPNPSVVTPFIFIKDALVSASSDKFDNGTEGGPNEKRNVVKQIKTEKEYSRN